MPHLGVGQEVQDGIDHAEAGAQDRDDAEADADARRVGLADRRAHPGGREGQVERGLDGEKLGQAGDTAPEFARGGGGVAQAGQMVLHQGMIDGEDGHGGSGGQGLAVLRATKVPPLRSHRARISVAKWTPVS